MPATRADRWGLAAAISSVTVFGLSVGQAIPLMSLLLEKRGIDPAVNGLNAGGSFIGVIVGPLLASYCLRRIATHRFLLICLALDIAAFQAMFVFDSLGAWFALRMTLGLIGSSVFTASEAWINSLVDDATRGRIIGIYGAALSAGFGLGPLILSLTGIRGWAPFAVNGAITALATLPLLAARSSAFGSKRAAHPLAMFLRAPLIIAAVTLFGLYETGLMALLPVWGVHNGMSVRLAATTLTAVYAGAIAAQFMIGWLSDKVSRVTALRLCGFVGVVGAAAIATMGSPGALLFALLLVWGGMASGIYPVALSMAGDRFRGGELVSVNAAIVTAYGLGGLIGPALGGAAMMLRDPQGLPMLFVLLFALLLGLTMTQRVT
jgi:MFS family permease